MCQKAADVLLGTSVFLITIYSTFLIHNIHNHGDGFESGRLFGWFFLDFFTVFIEKNGTFHLFGIY